MKLTTAIKILKSEQKHGVIVNMENWNKAITLGIEALKRIKHKRNFSPHLELSLLPGETEKDTH